ncbi:MAG: zinc ribbon domain-containing protein [Asgard group archaeon]|nr:zinc ribbon domain-containing protein [Asgard group archaeon]
MGKKTCKYCGEYIEVDSRFCYYCGSSVGEEKTPIQEVEEKGEDIYSHTIQTDYKEPAKGKRKLKITSGVIIAFVIIGTLAVVLPVTFISIYGPLNYKYIGATTFDSGVLVTDNATLSVYNFDGDINVEYNPYITEVLMVEIFVYGRSEANILEVEAFSVNLEDDTVEFIFNNDEEYSFWDKTAMRYEIYINLNPSVDFAFDLETFSGNIEIDLDYSTNRNITGIKLQTFSGNIDADFALGKQITTPVFYVKASSGNIDLRFGTDTKINTTHFYVDAFSGNIYIDFEGSNELFVDGQIELISTSGRTSFYFGSGVITADILEIDGFSGNIYLGFGSSTDVTLDEIIIDNSSGNIEIECDQCTFYSNVTWNINAFSGNVDIWLDPIILSNVNYTADFNVDITSGDIYIEYGFSESQVGVQIIAATTSGNIDLPGGTSFYQSPDYALKTKKYLFDLETFSGNIDVSNY